MGGPGQPTPSVCGWCGAARHPERGVSDRVADQRRGRSREAPLGLRGATLREIPDGDGAAVYALHNPFVPDQPLHMVVLLLDLPGDGACEPHVGAALWLDDQGRITREERYHRVDSVRSCLDTSTFRAVGGSR